MTATDDVSGLVQEVLAAVSGRLTEGLTPDEGAWVLAAYRNVVLPHQLRFAAGEDAEMRRRRASIAIRDIEEDYGAVSGAAKLRKARFAYYFARLAPLSDAIFELAQLVESGQEPSAEKVADARRLHEGLRALHEEMARDAPDILPALGDLLSEALVDCRYVIGNRNIVSLRLNRVIEGKRLTPRCPSCGTQNPPTTRFCTRCGTQLPA
jgi:hypothetical protein